jgi:hypothetical protein
MSRELKKRVIEQDTDTRLPVVSADQTVEEDVV